MKAKTKEQKNALALLENFIHDPMFQKQYAEAVEECGDDYAKLVMWVSGYIMKMTPEPDRITEIHKVL